MNVYTKEQIQNALDIPKLLLEIEKGLIAYSQNRTVSPPVGFLHLKQGEVHIKSGYIIDDDCYVIKVASGFYNNPSIGLPSSNGMMMLFSQQTGELKAILLDEGLLTDLRTALVGAICAKYLANKQLQCIGIIGTGIQAMEQLRCLQYVTSCRKAMIWGRNREKAKSFINDPRLQEYHLTIAETIDEVAANCDLIVTATTSTKPLLFGSQIRPGTHITAVGADDPSKQELDESVFPRANTVVADSIFQCKQFGDFSHARKDIPVIELGSLIENPILREYDDITVADLTGLAVEDLQIAKTVYKCLNSGKTGKD